MCKLVVFQPSLNRIYETGSIPVSYIWVITWQFEIKVYKQSGFYSYFSALFYSDILLTSFGCTWYCTAPGGRKVDRYSVRQWEPTKTTIKWNHLQYVYTLLVIKVKNITSSAWYNSSTPKSVIRHIMSSKLNLLYPRRFCFQPTRSGFSPFGVLLLYEPVEFQFWTSIS